MKKDLYSVLIFIIIFLLVFAYVFFSEHRQEYLLSLFLAFIITSFLSGFIPDPETEKFRKEFADFEYMESGFIEGYYRNHRVKFGRDNDFWGTGDEPSYTKLEVELEGPAEFDMYICPESFTEKVIKFSGQPDIEVGDPQFDDLFIIHGTSESAIQSFLDQSIQWKIRSAASYGFKRLRLHKNEIKYDMGEIGDKEIFKLILDVMVDLAEKIEEEHSTEVAKEFDEEIASYLTPKKPKISQKIVICPECGAENKGDDFFCRDCNHPLRPYVEPSISYEESYMEPKLAETKIYKLWARIISVLFGLFHSIALISYLDLGARLLESGYVFIAYGDLLVGLLGLFLILIGLIPNIICPMLSIDTTTKFRVAVLCLIILPFLIGMIEPEAPDWYYTTELVALTV